MNILNPVVFDALLKGALSTLSIAAQAGLLAILVSLVVGILRGVNHQLVQFLLNIYVEFFRGTSAFIQLYWAYFALPLLGLNLSPLQAGISVLALNVGAYGSEIVRGAIRAVPNGQYEAGASLGIPKFIILFKILLPQAMIRAILPLSNLMIDLLKGTSLLSAITITELAFAGRQLVSAGAAPMLIFSLILLIYFCMTAPISWGGRRLDNYFRSRQKLDGKVNA